MTNTSRWLSLIFALMLVCVPISSGAVSPLKIGVAPNGEDSVSLAELWIPFLEKVEKSSGVTLRFATAPDLLEFNKRLSQGEYDIVVTDQYLYTIFSQKHHLTYLAELTRGQEDTAIALVAAPDIKKIEQLKGALLAVKEDEKTGNIQSLDDYLTSKGVTALRDSLTSYEKILESIDEELHVAGLVPAKEAERADQHLNILWQFDNKHSYVMTSPPDIAPETLAKLVSALKGLLSSSRDENGQVSVLSVREDSLKSEAQDSD